jgi:hypothetical protein
MWIFLRKRNRYLFQNAKIPTIIDLEHFQKLYVNCILNSKNGMLKQVALLFFFTMILFANESCNSSKIPCPTYADSAPPKKSKHVTPGSQKPEMPKATKARSGVLPSDGKGTKTVTPTHRDTYKGKG